MIPTSRPVDPDRFDAGKHHWTSAPSGWERTPEDRLLSAETREQVRAAIAALPPSQQEVITLRDIEGWGSEEVCNVLKITESNQRVLLHRARSKVKSALDEYLADQPE
jgi:RNA polymerase sigma-70 factor (ECF subfamily)